MKILIAAVGVLLAVSAPSKAAFSEFVVLPTDSEKKRRNLLFEPWVFAEDESSETVTVLLLCHYFDRRVFTRIESKRRLEDDELNFREMIWQSNYRGSKILWGEKHEFPEYVAESKPVELIARIGKPELGLGIASFEVARADLDKCYLFADYAELTFDGGYYYCLRLSSFEITTESKAEKAIGKFMRNYRLQEGPISEQQANNLELLTPAPAGDEKTNSTDITKSANDASCQPE